MPEQTLDANRVRDIAAHEWRPVLAHVKEQVRCDRLPIVAAGVAFYALLAIFPAVAAITAIYGLVFDPGEVTRQVSALQGLLPEQALGLVLDELRNLTSSGRTALGWGAAGGLLVTIWSATRGVKTLMEALNVTYGEREERGLLKLNAVALLLTLAAIAGACLAIATIVLVPVALSFLGVAPLLGGLIAYARWPILAVFIAAGIAVMYRYGPSRERPDWSLVIWGAMLATLLWLVASALFSLYVSSFGNFNRTYGSIAAIVVLMMWFLLSAWAVLIGAEVNGALERRIGRVRR